MDVYSRVPGGQKTNSGYNVRILEKETKLTRDRPIRYGMFAMPIHSPDKPMAQCYDEDLELIGRCEEWAFDEFWVGEHHSSTYENIVMPEIFLGKAFGLTKKIRLGPAPVCLQYHNPFHVAGRLAFLDHLSHGRLNLCFGPGAVPSDLEMFEVDPQESGARVAEALDMILKIWTNDPPFEIQGEFWKLRLKEKIAPDLGVGSLHKPLQRPWPPIALPCIRRGSQTIKTAAARGFQLFSHHMTHPVVLKNHWDTYSEVAQGIGKRPKSKDWKITRNIFVAGTTEEARRQVRRNSVCWSINYILELTRRFAGDLGMWKREPEMTDAECDLDYFAREVVIAGDPEEVTRQILGLREEVGPFGTLVLVAHDWDDRAAHLRSLELFAKEVIPALDQQLTAV